MPPFKFADVKRLRDATPKRRRFIESSDDLNADGSFSLSFRFASVARLFERETGLTTRDGPYGPWAKFTGEKEIAEAKKWKSKRDQTVFLHDNLDYSIALDLNLAGEGEYTELGLAEHRAKQDRDKASVKALSRAMSDAIDDLPPYRKADVVCAVPPSPGKSWDLPTEIAKRIATRCGKDDESNAVKFTKKKDSVK